MITRNHHPIPSSVIMPTLRTPPIDQFCDISVHTENNPSLLIEPLRKAISDLDPNLAVSNIGRLGELVANSFAIRQLASR